MLQYKLKPNIIDFNLMLRCIRECSFGDSDLINNVIEDIIKESNKFFRKKVQQFEFEFNIYVCITVTSNVNIVIHFRYLLTELMEKFIEKF